MRSLFQLIRFLFRLMAGLLIVALLLTGFFWGFFQTSIGLSMLERLIQRQLSKHLNQEVEFSGLTGHPPFHIYVQRLAIADKEGEWLRVEHFRFDCSFHTLFTGTFRLDGLGADYVNLQRIPPSPEIKTKKEKSASKTIRLPAFLPSINLKEIYIHQLILGESIAKIPAEFTVQLSAAMDLREHIQVDAELKRVDGLVDDFSFRLAITNQLREGTVRLRYDEGSGGLFGLLAGERFHNMQLSIDGSGPITNWLGTCHVQAGSKTNRANIQASYCFSEGNFFELDWKIFDSLLHTDPAGYLQINAPLNRPVIALLAEAEQVNISDLAQIQLDPFDLSIEAVLADGHLKSSILTTGLVYCAVDGSSDIPIDLSFNPFIFNLSKDQTSTADLKTYIDLKLFSPYLQTFQQNIKGILQSSLSLRGSLANPLLNGYIKMDDGLYENLKAGTMLRNIDLEINLEDDRLLIRKMTANDATTGTIELSGKMSFDAASENPMDFRLQINDALLINQQMISATLDADISVTGSTKRIFITGTSIVENASINIHQSMPPDVTELQVEEINKPGEEFQKIRKKREPPAIVRQVMLNLEVLSTGKIFVKGRGLDSEWKSDIKIAGSAGEPQITGALNLVRGSFMFLGKRLKLTQCTVSMLGGLPFVPQIDLRASTTTSELVANLRIYGPATQPQISLTSEPSYPQDEILSMMLFAKRPDELSATEALKIAYGVNVLRGGFDGLSIFDKAQQMLGVDQIGLSSGDNNKTQLTVGKYIGNYIYVEGEKSLQGSGDTLKVDINLTPSIQLRTKTTTEDGQGESIYLNWHRDY